MLTRTLTALMTLSCCVAGSLGLSGTLAQRSVQPAPPPALSSSRLPPAGFPQSPLQQGPPLELVHAFRGPMPVGVAVNSRGRIFVTYPRWEDPLPYSLAEIRGGREVPYPNAAINATPIPYDDNRFIGVQGLTVDARDRLWVLDTGTFDLGPVLSQTAPKLVGIDTATNRVIQTIRFPASVVLKNTYLNDLRIDLRYGAGGVAYITDSGAKSGAGIIVVDLASGRSWRKLTGDPTVLPVPGFVSFPDGRALLERPPGGPARTVSFAADSIAISPNGDFLYYAPVASRRLYAVPTAALRDESLSDAAVKAQVRDLGEKGVSDGLAEDTAGNIYTTNHELNAIFRRRPDGEFDTVVRDPRLIWPDTLSLQGGYLYLISNQLNRQAKYHYGRDERVPPYGLFRVRVDARPVLLR